MDKIFMAFIITFGEKVLNYGFSTALQIMKDWMDGISPTFPEIDMDDIEQLKNTPPPEDYFK